LLPIRFAQIKFLNQKEVPMRTRSLVISATMIFIWVLALTVIALAAEPIIGTWKINASKSKLAPVGDWVKEMTVTYREVGDQLTYEAKGALINGASVSSKGNRPLVGGIVKRQPPNAEGIIDYVTVIGPGDAYVTYLKNGKQILVEHYVVSKDGKSHAVAVKGTDEKGKPAEALYFLDRQ
jgi:hypothetical protein